MTRTALIGAWLAGAFLVFILAPVASAKVGVTSTSDGNPKGKPPAQDERILRVGIDIQADELVTTGPEDRVHLVFLDGTSLTVSSNARLKIDRFVYDPAQGNGDIAITATKGVFRLVGGKISKATAITVDTPSASLGLRGGIGLFTVDSSRTSAYFLFGKSLEVTASGHTQTAFRPGSEIQTSFGGPPGLPTLVPASVLTQPLHVLEGSRSTANTRPDDQAKRSGFSDQNSGRTYQTFQDLGSLAVSQTATQALSQIHSVPTPPTQIMAPTTAAAAGAASAPPPPPPPPLCPPMNTSFHHHHHHHFPSSFPRH
jgi:hypothetical protein